MQSNYRYEIILYWSDEDESFIAEIPELPGCAADGAKGPTQPLETKADLAPPPAGASSLIFSL